MINEFKERKIRDDEPTEGIVIECNNSTSFAVVKYLKSKNRFHENLIKIIEYDDWLFYPIEFRCQKLLKLIGTKKFKIRDEAFYSIFFDCSED